MTYVVTVDTCIPEGTPEMDPLQRAGAVALIEDGFDSVRSVKGPEGVEVALLDTIVAVHPGGALLKVIVDAPALEFAEDTVQALVDELLERSALLADWTIERCEVELHQDLAKESLDAAEGPDAPPDDLAARKARHTAGPSGEGPANGDDATTQTAAVRTQMLRLAEALRSFSPATFGATGAGEGGAAALAAGALLYATDILVDELFEDLQVLTREDVAVAECEGPLWHLEHLPDRYALQYDARFARRFLVTVIAMTTRFTDGSFQRLGCVAEGLALRLLLNETTSTLELYGLLDDDVSAALDTFADRVYEGTDDQWLYDDALGVGEGSAAGPRAAPLAFGSWFTPFDESPADSGYVHPSAADDV
ncbi:hypothetical protein PYK79_25585 [Streptomyces sp. ID05-04B]|uniref:hypothetical protein n=1 Tax=unclassified Streptomyces TaxID=2593676 RepID=UPI000D1BF768|nr:MULTISPECIES: hypothetical protein [unclassified Streptomyces]AVV44487.1 hypothetical protein C6376_26670 [Streptomyces sp. P3]MDX5566002.1 hypothetical protein [Streptomyces sp. ID05-04B]